MAAPPLIVIWVMSAELASPTTSSLRATAREALGGVTQVQIVADTARPGDDVASVTDSRVALARITWDASEHRRAHVACYVPRLRRWVEEEVVFAPTDADPERGRTLGFLIASMIADGEMTEPSGAKPVPAAPGPLESRRAELPAGAAARTTMSLSAAAEASGPGIATGFGAWLGAEHAVAGRSLWLGVGARARFGSISVAQSTTRFLAGGGHVTWRAYQASSRSWLGVRSGLFVSHLQISHFSDDDLVPDDQGRWLPGADIALHAELELTPSAGLFMDFGAELLAGSTEVWVRQRMVAVWPRGSGLLRLGLQTGF